MIEMCVRENDIADLLTLTVINGNTEAPRIDCDTVVDNERGQMLPRRRAAVVVECAGKQLKFHQLFLIRNASEA